MGTTAGSAMALAYPEAPLWGKSDRVASTSDCKRRLSECLHRELESRHFMRVQTSMRLYIPGNCGLEGGDLFDCGCTQL